MGADLLRLPHRLNEDLRTCDAVIETPRGSRCKYDFDPKAGAFRLQKLLSEGQSFPLDYGFVPSTLAEDGDPLDIMVLMDEPGIVGGIVAVRILGVIEIESLKKGSKLRNHRIVAAALETHLYGKFRTLGDLDPDMVRNLGAFWEVKGSLGKTPVRVIGISKPEAAVMLIREASLKTKQT